MITRTDKLAHELEAARREWEELDPKYTPFEARKKAETRVLTLTALLRASGVSNTVSGPTPPRTAAGWKRAAVQASR